MTLDTFYNGSWQYLLNGSIGHATTLMLEEAFINPYIPYLILFCVVMVLLYIRTQNLGLVGVIAGVLSEGLFQLGKFPVYFHTIAYLVMGLSFGLVLYLFFTEKDTG